MNLRDLSKISESYISLLIYLYIFRNFNEFILVLQNNSSHSILIRVKCEK